VNRKQEEFWSRIATAMDAAEGDPPSSRDLAGKLCVPIQAIDGILKEASRERLVTEVSPGIWFTSQKLAALEPLAASTKDLREKTGMGRRHASAVAAYFRKEIPE
jgi:hypothetical protein